jgi:alpha-mannosidase
MEFNLNYKLNQINEIKDMIYHTLSSRIDRVIYQPKIAGAHTKEPVSFHERLNLNFREYKIGESWGDLFDCAWFNIYGKVNPKCKEVHLRLDLSGEACLFDSEGTPLKGFTNGSSVFDRQHGEPGKNYYMIDDLINDKGEFSLWIDAAANDLFGSLQNQGKILLCDLVERHPKTLELFYDLEVLHNMLTVFDEPSEAHQYLFNTLRQIYYLVIYEKRNWIEESLKLTKPFFTKKTTSKLTVYATGHAHIDLAWLWPIRETKRKAGRTISNVLYLLKKYPSFVFGISQPQLLVWTQEYYPKLFQEMKYYVEKGRIELQGGMWVEADTNLSGGESLIRQFYYGMEYYNKEFNQQVNNLWLPDVFGYQGNLPQLIKGSGLDFFMTTKLSWSLVNRFPHHTFIWRGIDGSEVICHIPPEGTYNSSIKPQTINYMENHYIEKNDIPYALNLYGIGDGGGGPGEEHLERVKRIHDLDPLPKVKLRQAKELFLELAKFRNEMKVYEGELYLENHQGTLTSHTKVKKYNRFIENKLKTVEMLLVLSEKYVKHVSVLDELWKEFLLYQFHDILPGSSISRVYEECLVGYEKINQKLDQIISLYFPSYSNDLKQGLPFNPNLKPTEKLHKLDNTYERIKIAPFSNHLIDKKIYYFDNEDNETVFQTKNLLIEFSSKTGFIHRIYHKTKQRELLINKEANQLSVYRDLGDAWNIMMHYREQEPTHMELIKRSVNHYGETKEIIQKFKFKNSTLNEIITIDYENDRLDFNHHLDWQDSGYMLRTNFPLDIHTEEAFFDIQFGEIKRTRKTDTSMNKAKFEVCAHNWVSMHDEIGVSLINNGKYGFSVQEDYFDMNLLRSTTYPSHNQDIGETSHAYALIIHDGSHHHAKIDHVAQAFNDFMPIFKEQIMFNSIVNFESEHIDLVLVKGSKEDNSVVVRFNEKQGIQGKIEVEWPKWAKAIYETNLIEKEAKQINSFMLEFKPFEIRTFKIK